MARSRKPGPDPVEAALAAFLADHPGIRNLRVALSGGRDSIVLLHALVRLRPERRIEVVHVHHGLHARADEQAAHCREFSADLGLTCEVRPVSVPAAPEEGLEACARELRYEALSADLTPGDCVLTAHHGADQAETFLLAALKGSGPPGLAAMPRLRRLGVGWLGRPLLGCPGAALQSYAVRQGLRWIEDPSNRDPRFDRNFLRLEVLPVLSRRFPVERRLGAAAALQADALAVLEGLLDGLLETLCGPGGDTLDIAGLLGQPLERRSWLLRRFTTRAGWPPPRREPLLEFLRQLGSGSDNARPELHWDRVSLRTHGGRVHLVPAPTAVDAATAGAVIDWPAGASSLRLPDGRLLTLEELRAAGVSPERAVQICFRRGGEMLRTPGGRRRLKSLM
jgi:tRNA(Ile)-lysidine synthase